MPPLISVLLNTLLLSCSKYNTLNLYKWKVLVVRVNGSGALGEVLSNPIIAAPNEGYTQTFIGIGGFNSKEEGTILYLFSVPLPICLDMHENQNHGKSRQSHLQR